MKRIVTIGGGTGSFVLLSGLKKYDLDLSAIVSMADDGGSTGILRDELGVLPPGDVRQCLAALSDSASILRELLGYRFEEGSLKGHNFGNLFLSALSKINGNFLGGIDDASKILNVKGKVIPVSEEEMNLNICLKNGKILKGENQLDHNENIQKIGLERVFLKPSVRANRKAAEAILKAHFVVIGPGDLYGSIMPNLLVFGISEALRKTRAKIIYVSNLTNKRGQTDAFNIDDYVGKINEAIGKNRIDFVILNNKKIPNELVGKYEKREGKNAVVGIEEKKKREYRIIQADILSGKISRKEKSDAISFARSFIRHDSEKLAKTIMLITELDNYKNIIKDIL